ncbi:MAG: cyclase family protein [Chloroflexota bacterium]
MNIIDLTGLIEEGMWLDNPLILPPVIERFASVDGPTGWDAHRFTLSTIMGTYMEASAHLFLDGETIDQVLPERFICPAVVLSLPDCFPNQAICADDLRAVNADLHAGDAVLISTGWERRWNKTGFVEESPYFTLDAMQWLLDTGAAIIGADLPCFDSPTRPEGVVKLLFQHGRLLVAPLINLRLAGEKNMLKSTLIALPLKIKGVCGTPCRAILVDSI